MAKKQQPKNIEWIVTGPGVLIDATCVVSRRDARGGYRQGDQMESCRPPAARRIPAGSRDGRSRLACIFFENMHKLHTVCRAADVSGVL